MVGFKSIALLISLLVLAACVPQTKQTSCSTNEAFNATLRTCVPVMNGPSSFINIDSFLPSSSFAKYKNDTTPVTLSIVIDNPYAQTYTVVWEHLYLGNPVTILPSTPTSFSFSPSLYSSQLGTHIISVKVKDANFNIVDSHSFEFKIDDTLKPVIDNSSVSPMYSPVSFTPLVVADQYFKFTVKNNSAIMVGAGYKVVWKLDKSGTGEITAAGDTDVFPTTLPAGVGTIINNAGFNYPSYSFNPAALGVGDYLLSAKLTNSAGDLVDFKYWNVNVKHPSLSKVSARDIYSGSTSVGFGTYSTAYSGVAYTDYSSLQPLDKGFIPSGQSTQGNYCVTLTNAEGTYIGDSQYVRVDYYLDGASLVYSTTTSTAVGGNKVCLSNAGAALANLKFVTAGIPHWISARVVDQATGQEYTASDMNAALGDYPIRWNFTVLEANAAPIVTFTDDSNLSPSITCGTASSNARTCEVTQDQAFTVGISVTDDFYSTSSTTDSIQNKFSYTMTLKRNGTTLSTCTKTIADVNEALPSPDVVGPDYLCSFTVPSYDATGSVDPSAFAYTVTTVFSDVGSPIAGALPATGTSFTYNLNVTEANTPPVIVPQGITTSVSYLANSNAPSTALALASNDSGLATTYITEGDVLMVKVLVNDTERDDHQITLSRCTDGPACGSTTTIETKTVLKTDNVLGTLTTFSYTIPEDVVPTSTPFGTNVDTYFKIEVIDNPDNDGPLVPSPVAQTAATSTVSPLHFNVNVRNKNPAPQFAMNNLSISAPIVTMVGYPLTIDPGTITDMSVPASEKVISYQWYIDVDAGDDSYTAISGATSRLLTWTPTNGILPGQIINLSLCVSDGTTVNPQPSVGNIGTIIGAAQPGNGPNCLGSWDVTVRPNVVALNNDGGGSDVGSDMAVWQDTTVTNKKIIYSAYSDISGKIFVEKTVFEDNGLIHNNNVDGFQSVSFDAINGLPVAVSSIKDISISGTNDFLYIAYQAAPLSTPGSPIIRIRRIDKRQDAPLPAVPTVGSKTDTSYPEDGKFGFRYSQNLPISSTSNITISPSPLGGPYQVSFVGALTSGNSVTVNGIPFVASDTAPTNGVLCSGGSLGCSVSGNASLLATAINSSNSRSLQGLTAVAVPASGNVLIYGDVGGESLDLSAYVTGKLGKIMTDNSSGSWKWYLPFVDASTALSQIRVLEAPAEVLDSLQGMSPNDSVIYNQIGAVTSFVNDAFGGTMVIGSINTSSIAKLHLFTFGSATSSSNVTLFGGAPVAAGSLRVAARVLGNFNYFAAAKVLVTSPATYEWKFGRYSTSLTSPFDLSGLPLEDTFSSLSFNTPTGTVLGVSNIADLSIEAYPSSNEARIMVSSKDTGSDYRLYAVRYRSDGDLSCDLCVPLTYGTQKLSASGKIATTKIDTNMNIGSTNLIPTVRNVFFTAYSVNSTPSTVYKPQVGIINAQVETMSTTSTVSTGTNGFRPPFFGSN